MSCNVVWCDRYTGEDCGITWCPAYLPRNTSNTIDVKTIITDDTKNNYVKVVRCKDCKHSIKKNYDVDISYEYLCVLKSTVTHLEEHEANYFCADGERKESKVKKCFDIPKEVAERLLEDTERKDNE